MREGEVVRVDGGVGVQRRLDPLGQVVRGEGRRARPPGWSSRLVGPPRTANAPPRTPGRPASASSRCAATPWPCRPPSRRRRERHAADRRATASRRCPCPWARCGVAVEHRDVLDGTPSGSAAIWLHAVSWPCPCGDVPVTTSTLPVGSTRTDGVLPAAGDVRQRAQHPRRRQAAHLGEGRDADAELDGVARRRGVRPARRAARRSRTAPWPWRWRPRSCRESYVSPAIVVYGNSSCVIQLRRRSSSGSIAELGRQLVHHPLDGERRLRPAGAPVGVGRRRVGEDAGAGEVVGVHLVDAR